MERPLTLLGDRCSENWLLNLDAEQLQSLTHQYWQTLQSLQRQVGDRPLRVLIAKREPLPFLAGFLATVSSACAVALGNPGWGEQEWQEALTLIQPDWILGERSAIHSIQSEVESNAATALESGWILIPTGGSSGRLHFAIHTWQTLGASVEGLQKSHLDFPQGKIHSCCVLPLYHVSGLMQFLRSLLSGGQFYIDSFQNFCEMLLRSSSHLKEGAHDVEHFCLSLVPTQLQHLLNVDNSQILKVARKLCQFKVIFLGGAPPWESLLTQARQLQLPVALTYGMTETASQIVTLNPVDFFTGQVSCGQVLPHAQVKILDNLGQAVAQGQIGQIGIRSESLCHGYYPQSVVESRCLGPYFLSDDLGYIDALGFLYIVGRNSQKIITGGENVFPQEIEHHIWLSGLVADVVVFGVPDQHWGQAVVAAYTPAKPTVLDSPSAIQQQLHQQLRRHLSAYKCPKHWLVIDQIPRNSQGKINYLKLQKWAKICLHSNV